jgi:dipeptidase D
MGIVPQMEHGPYDGLEPVALWQHFAALNAIPRPSGHESAAREYVRGVVEASGANWRTDAYGNGIARVAASRGYEGAVVAIQSHLDMVCEQAPGVEHDCVLDPIVPQRDGDRITASGTTWELTTESA